MTLPVGNRDNILSSKIQIEDKNMITPCVREELRNKRNHKGHYTCIYSQTCLCGQLYQAVTCVKRLPFKVLA